MAGNIERRGRRWWLTVWDSGSARSVHDEKPSGLLSHVEAVEVLPAEQLEGAVELSVTERGYINSAVAFLREEGAEAEADVIERLARAAAGGQ